MTRSRGRIRVGLCAASVSVAMLLTPQASSAQLTGSSAIAGVARDSSGAVLPGVTVEAASPALIEKVRTVVTDDQGQYKIVGLVSGVYVVTFTLPGFKTIKREGIELTANFTAAVTGEMSIGGVEETVVVSGQSPVVDLQSTSARNLIAKSALDALPVGKTLEAFIALTPGMGVAGGAVSSQDVGGSKGELYVQMVIHGGRGTDMRTLLDGFETNNLEGGGAGRVFVANPSSTQEISLELGAGSAEVQTTGVQVNFIPKDGSNRFAAEFIANYTNDSLQSSVNLTDSLRARGLVDAQLGKIVKIYDANGSLGGPLLRDRLWFFASYRAWGNVNTIIGGYYNATPGTLIFTPGDNALSDNAQHVWNGRFTWQASSKHKVTFSYDNEYRCQCFSRGGPSSGPVNRLVTPEASRNPVYTPTIYSATWSFPATNKLLLSAAFMIADVDYSTLPQPGQPNNQISILELSNNFRYSAVAPDTGGAAGYGQKRSIRYNSRAALSYVTGSHAFKAGMQLVTGHKGPYNNAPTTSPVSYTFLNGVPNSLALFAYPIALQENVRAGVGLFAQDQWTIKALTVNAGLRYDSLNAYTPDQHLPAGQFVPARDFAGVECVPCWHDLSPRISGAYDLFGNGKTALKASFGRYVAAEMLDVANANDPVLTATSSTTRSWTDGNRNFAPDCILSDPAANGECGAAANANFGKSIITTRWDDQVLTHNRPFAWQSVVTVQQELRPGTALSVSYFRTNWNNFRVTDNVATTGADFSSYCVTLPADARLPGGGGNAVCGLYNVNPNKVGQVNNLIVNDSTFGKQTETFNGLDFVLNARLPRGSFVGGGVSVGGSTLNNCFANGRPDLGATYTSFTATAGAGGVVANNPTDFCEVTQPFWHPQLKLSGAYRLPWQLQASALWQNLPSVPIVASYVATNAQVAPSLGRSLSGGAASVTIANIIRPFTMFEDRINQFDVRLTRTFKVATARVQAQFDVYNLFNGNAVLAENTRYGAAWLTPSTILDPRLVKFGVQVNF